MEVRSLCRINKDLMMLTPGRAATLLHSGSAFWVFWLEALLGLLEACVQILNALLLLESRFCIPPKGRDRETQLLVALLQGLQLLLEPTVLLISELQLRGMLILLLFKLVHFTANQHQFSLHV